MCLKTLQKCAVLLLIRGNNTYALFGLFQPSTIDIYYIAETKTTVMYDDDMMLNIARPTKKVAPQQESKQDNKKQKYSIKFKKERALNRRNRPTEFNYNLLPTADPVVQTPKPQKKEQAVIQTPAAEPKEAPENIKRPRNFQRQDRTASNSGLNGNKRQKFDRNEKYNRYDRNERSQVPVKVEQLDAQKVKITTPEQIKPQLVKSENKIDVNPLQQFNLNSLLKDSLIANGISKFTNIQISCYKSIFSGKDVIAKASTGSGKTLAYLVPLINQYLQKKTITEREVGTVMLIICPSRQLCVQGQKEALRCFKRCPFIVPGSLIGGEQTNHQKNRLRKGVNVLFTTPGRLLYHLNNTKSFKLINLKTIVFEEADRTLDMGFHQNVTEILEILSKKLDITYLQKVLVSAHFNQKVQDLIANLNMDNPKYIGFQGENDDPEGDNHANLNVKQINISKNLKQQYVLMTEEERIPMMIAYLRLIKDSKVMIFVNTIDEVEYLDFLLNNMNFRDSNGNFTQQKVQNRKVFKIHGNLDQKYRTNTYFEFKKEKSAILISTEVASRGLDFPDLNHIILFDVPPTLTDYGNRVGRSARFNSSGVSLLMLHYQESDYAEQIRYYCPTLELLDKQIIFEGFEQYLQRMNIREKGLYYLEGVVRSLVKDDDEKYQLARKAYVSMLRAYAKLKDKHTFAVKKLDLKLLGRCFGINSTGGKMKTYNPKAKQSHLESLRKKRRVQNVKSLQISEYL